MLVLIGDIGLKAFLEKRGAFHSDEIFNLIEIHNNSTFVCNIKIHAYYI